MYSLEKVINDDWFDIKEQAEDPDTLEKKLELTTGDLKNTVTNIHISVEEGIIEYKRRVLAGLYATIDSLQYDSKQLGKLNEDLTNLSAMIYIVIIQRNIASGIIELKVKSGPAHEENQEANKVNIREIIKDVTDRIREKPDFQTLPEVKNILLQAKIYSKEMTELNSLKPNIPKEKLNGFLTNYKKRFDEIAASMAANYKAITDAEENEARSRIISHPLKRYDLHSLSKIYWRQAKEFARIRSTLQFIVKEKYQTREYLVSLGSEKNERIKSVEEEYAAYGEMGKSDEEGKKISRMVGAEAIKILEKQISWRTTKHEA